MSQLVACRLPSSAGYADSDVTAQLTEFRYNKLENLDGLTLPRLANFSDTIELA